jgi:DNA-binding transcriptional ArsR family regulator
LKDLLVLDDLEQVKALAVPVRVEIIMSLNDQPMTTTQIARLLGEKPNRLYYHVTELERVGILEVVETKQKGNLVEKYYLPVARVFRIDPALFARGSEGREAWLQTVISHFDSTIIEYRRRVADENVSPSDMERAFSSILDFGLTADELTLFRQELRELILKWGKVADLAKPGRAHLTAVFYTSRKPAAKGRKARS